MANETKEEKAAREAQEAEAILAKEAEDARLAEEAKQAEELRLAAEAEEKAKAALAETPAHLQEVALNDESPSVVTNVHTIYHAKGSTEFVDGVANVNSDVAAHLKESGQVK